MARIATWMVMLALVIMPLLNSGSVTRVSAQDGGDQSAETVDTGTTSEETADDGETAEGDGEGGETATVEPTPTDTPTETPTEEPTVEVTPTDEATATEEISASETPTEEIVPTATTDPSTDPTATATGTTDATATATSTPKATSTPSKVKAAEVTAVAKLSDIVVTINCTGKPERVRVTNNGSGDVRIKSIGSIYGASSKEPFSTANKKINGGNTFEWTFGPEASGRAKLHDAYIFTNTAYDDEGAIVSTSVGSITKRCPAAPPTSLSDIKVTINCTSDPEKIRVTNNGSQSITVYSIGTLYTPISGEPFNVDKVVQGSGATRAWSAGSGSTGNYVLSKSFIFTNSAYDKDGVKVATSSGTITVRCPAKPVDPYNGAKWIEVDLSDQYMIAWQNGVRVNETYVSTGRPGFDTPVGTWYINTKLTSQTMSGCIQGECYYVPDVPWVMYFTDWGHAIHGAYWHSNFGQTMSHGCVNLPVSFAEWLYYWTPYGTPVVVKW